MAFSSGNDLRHKLISITYEKQYVVVCLQHNYVTTATVVDLFRIKLLLPK